MVVQMRPLIAIRVVRWLLPHPTTSYVLLNARSRNFNSLPHPSASWQRKQPAMTSTRTLSAQFASMLSMMQRSALIATICAAVPASLAGGSARTRAQAVAARLTGTMTRFCRTGSSNSCSMQLSSAARTVHRYSPTRDASLTGTLAAVVTK